MTNRTTTEIEAEIEAERSALAASLEDLQEQFSPERVLSSVTSQLRDNGGDAVASVGRAVKENPIGLLVTGVGLALLLSGTGKSRRSDRAQGNAQGPDRPLVGFSRADMPVTPGINEEYDISEFDERMAALEERKPVTGWDELAEADALGDKLIGATANARSAIQSTARDAKAWAADATENIREGVDLDTLGSDVRAQADHVSSLTSAKLKQLRASISAGTENMSQGARDRILAARMVALDAAEKAEQHLDRAKQKTADTYYENPILMGLAAAAVGAAIGAALPRTRTENAHLGPRRDALFDQASRIYREELAKVKAVASAAADEAKAAASEGIDRLNDQGLDGATAVDAIDSAVAKVSNRVARRAKSEGLERNVGGSLKS